MNYYFASKLVAERQAAVAADFTHRAQLKDARTARKATAPGTSRPTRSRRLFGRLAIA